MNKQLKQQLESEMLGMTHNDRITARFYMFEVDDPNNQTIIESKKLADAAAQRTERITGKDKDPDYSVENLIRLGAKSQKIDVPFVQVGRAGSRDSISHKVTDEHKQQFSEQWKAFEAEHYDQIHSRRQDVRIEASGQVHQSGGISQVSAGNFSYSFNI